MNHIMLYTYILYVIHVFFPGNCRAETGSVESMSSAEVASRPSTAGFSSSCTTPFRLLTPLPGDLTEEGTVQFKYIK